MSIIWSLFLCLKGWSVAKGFPYDQKKCVVIVAPHTSSWDFVIGIAFRSSLHIKDARFLGKAELFRPPFGFIFRKLGGVPVERSKNQNLVEEVSSLFGQHDSFRLVLSPEGTRKKVDRLKTGFYHIAKNAGVPIIMASLDYAKKQVSFSDPFYPTSDEAADFRLIHQHYAIVQGKIPEQGMAHLSSQPHNPLP